MEENSRELRSASLQRRIAFADRDSILSALPVAPDSPTNQGESPIQLDFNSAALGADGEERQQPGQHEDDDDDSTAWEGPRPTAPDADPLEKMESGPSIEGFAGEPPQISAGTGESFRPVDLPTKGRKPKKSKKGKAKDELEGECDLEPQLALLRSMLQKDLNTLQDSVTSLIKDGSSSFMGSGAVDIGFCHSNGGSPAGSMSANIASWSKPKEKDQTSYEECSEDEHWECTPKPVMGFFESKQVLKQSQSTLASELRKSFAIRRGVTKSFDTKTMASSASALYPQESEAHSPTQQPASPLRDIIAESITSGLNGLNGLNDDDDDDDEGDGEAVGGEDAGRRDSICRVQNWALLTVNDPYFDYFFGTLVLLNALSIGLQTEWQAQNTSDGVPTFYRVLEIVFCFFFVLELGLRVAAAGREYFYVDWKWNLFDVVSVVFQVFELVGSLIAAVSELNTNFSFIRVIKILRLIRLMRLVRILRLIGELRALVTSIAGSLRSLVWAVLLLSLMIYVVGIYFTQIVTDYRIENDLSLAGFSSSSSSTDSASLQTIQQAWGSLGSTIFSLFQAVTGGVSWKEIVDPLKDEISFLIAPMFAFYILFALLCMFNVITGVFVETALLTAKADKNVYMVNHLRTLFQKADNNGNGRVSWSEFSKLVATGEMQEVFKQIDMDVNEADSLFRLLDNDDSGTISVNEFIGGCNRLRGTAKALELSILMKDMRKFMEANHKSFKKLEGNVHLIKRGLDSIEGRHSGEETGAISLLRSFPQESFRRSSK